MTPSAMLVHWEHRYLRFVSPIDMLGKGDEKGRYPVASGPLQSWSVGSRLPTRVECRSRFAAAPLTLGREPPAARREPKRGLTLSTVGNHSAIKSSNGRSSIQSNLEDAMALDPNVAPYVDVDPKRSNSPDEPGILLGATQYFRFTEGMSLDAGSQSEWVGSIEAGSIGLQPYQGLLRLGVSNAQSTRYRLATRASFANTDGTVSMGFRVRVNQLTGGPVALGLPGGIVLNLTPGTSGYYASTAAPSTRLAESAITANGQWRNILVSVTPTSLGVWEEKEKKLVQSMVLGTSVAPTFSLDVGAGSPVTASIDLSDVAVVSGTARTLRPSRALTDSSAAAGAQALGITQALQAQITALAPAFEPLRQMLSHMDWSWSDFFWGDKEITPEIRQAISTLVANPALRSFMQAQEHLRSSASTRALSRTLTLCITVGLTLEAVISAGCTVGLNIDFGNQDAQFVGGGAVGLATNIGASNGIEVLFFGRPLEEALGWFFWAKLAGGEILVGSVGVAGGIPAELPNEPMGKTGNVGMTFGFGVGGGVPVEAAGGVSYSWPMSSGPQQFNLTNTTASTPFVLPAVAPETGYWIYFRGMDGALWKIKDDGSQQYHIGQNATAGAQWTAASPFVLRNSSGAVWVYYMGTDRALWKVKDDGTELTHIGQNAPSGPQWTIATPFALADPQGSVWVYYVGTNGGPLWKTRDDGTQLTHIGHDMPAGPQWTAGTPFPVRYANGEVWVFYQGTDSALWKVKDDGSQLYRIGQSMPAGPQWTAATPFVLADPMGGAWVYFMSAPDGALCKIRDDGNQQSHIGQNTPTGAQWTDSTPFALRDANGVIWVYYQGTDNALWRIKDDGTELYHIGQNTPAGSQWTWATPFPVIRPDGDAWVFFRGTDNTLWGISADGRGAASQMNRRS
jgi:hypothetical protein